MGRQVITNVNKTYAQGGSIVVVIPTPVKSALMLDAGDYVVFKVDRDTGKIEISKFEVKGDHNAEDS